MGQSLRRCWQLMVPRERRQWSWTIPLAVAAALFEALSAGGVYLLLRAVEDPGVLGAFPFPTSLVPGNPRTILVAGTCAIAALYTWKTFTLALHLRWVSRAVAESSAALSGRVLQAYLSAPLGFHLQRNSSELLNTATQAADTVHQLVVASVASIAAEVLVLLGLAIVLALTAPPAAHAAVAIAFVLLFGIHRLTRRAFHGLGSEEQRARESVLRILSQAILGIKEVRLRAREAFVAESFGDERRKALSARSRFLVLSGVSRLILETTFVFGVLGVVLALAWSGTGTSHLVPVLAVYAYAGFRVIPSANRIQLHLGNIRFGLPAVERILGDLDACASGSDGPAAGAIPYEPFDFTAEMDFDDVAYAYRAGSTPVLDGLDLTIRRGESVGIVGATGAGKTTLVHLLLGFLRPVRGHVRVDGRDIHDNLRGWQKHLGYVPQNVHLIDDTLARNIAYCVPDEEMDADRLQRAIDHSQLRGFVDSLPDGMATVVGDRGIRLSGGERQRVAVARALYDDPDLLVFDEGTSSLDPHTERELTRAIEGLRGHKTLVVVAHRLGTVRGCDRIVFLEAGRVAATGSYEDLERNHAGFRRLAALGDDIPVVE